MDREQEELQFLGFIGVLKEPCNIVSSCRKIFAQITLFFILPLAFIYLAHIQITKVLFTQIMHNEYVLVRTPEGTQSYHKIDDLLTSEWTAFALFKIGYLIFFIILSLLSTSAVVYTIACVYTAKEVSLKKVLSVVPKVWKRLMVTFLWNFIIVFAYNLVSLLILILLAITVGRVKIVGIIFLIVFSIIYLTGFLYITIIWHLANVVSVLEESKGLSAMKKSRALIRGKMGISSAVFLLIGLCFFGIEQMFKHLVVFGDEEGVGDRIGFGVVCLILLPICMLLGLVLQTIVYFICKSYHHENIDKSSLADHLGGYLGEYVPLKTKDVQLEQFEV